MGDDKLAHWTIEKCKNYEMFNHYIMVFKYLPHRQTGKHTDTHAHTYIDSHSYTCTNTHILNSHILGNRDMQAYGKHHKNVHMYVYYINAPIAHLQFSPSAIHVACSLLNTLHTYDGSPVPLNPS